jgi:hypothetical protein
MSQKQICKETMLMPTKPPYFSPIRKQ